MCMAELGHLTEEPLFVDQILDAGALARASDGTLNLFDYLEAAAAGGFPDAALARSARARQFWLESYIHDLLHRDVRLAGRNADPGKLAIYLEAVASMSGGIVDQAALRDAAGVSAHTAAAYDALLEDVFAAERVPAWWTNRLAALTALPKRYRLDTSVMAAALRADVDGIARSADLTGRFLDTFAAMQLRPQLGELGGEDRGAAAVLPLAVVTAAGAPVGCPPATQLRLGATRSQRPGIGSPHPVQLPSGVSA
jgi:predicted AAA+ superfamily ATPase